MYASIETIKISAKFISILVFDVYKLNANIKINMDMQMFPRYMNSGKNCANTYEDDIVIEILSTKFLFNFCIFIILMVLLVKIYRIIKGGVI